MENPPVETDNEIGSVESLLKDAEKKPSASKETNLQEERSISFTASFLIEMIQFIKNTLLAINSVDHFSVEKSSDVEFRKYSQESIYQDVKKIDSVLNALLNYISISTPVVKKNTIHIILEGILVGNGRQLQIKNIRIFKKFEENLPETSIHDDQVKFILNSILEYAILSTPYDGMIAFLTRSNNQNGTGTTENEGKIVPPRIGDISRS